MKSAFTLHIHYIVFRKRVLYGLHFLAI